MPNEPKDWVFEIKMAHNGKGDWFTSDLLRLIAKADWTNRAKLAEAFPEHAAAHERWYRQEGEFATLDGPRKESDAINRRG